MRPRVSYLFRIGVAALLLLCAVQGAVAQLNEHCTVSVLNRTVQVNPDGSWVLPNVPANFGQVRARATCVQNGVTTSGESPFFTLSADGVVNLPEIILGTATPIPVSLSLTPGRVSFTAAGQTSQLAVTATYPDRSVQDVTAATTGTSYTTSNLALVTVSADGLVTAVASGTVVIQATHDGAAGLITATVALSSTDTDGDGIPDDVEIALGLNPNNPIDAQEDVDRDGLTNLQEYQRGTNIRVADSDGDSLPDGQEVALGTNPLLADTDGDGIRDGLEVQTGSNPLDPTSFNLAQALTALEVTPANLVITVNTILGEASWQLTVTGNLIDATSINLTSTSKGTTYASSNLTICNFGAQAGRVFAGAAGSCTVTVSNSGFSDTVSVLVQTFAPTAITSITIPGYANNVDVVGDDFAYVAAGAQGLQVVDVSNLAGIGNLPPNRIVGSLDTPGTAIDVKVVGNLAYIADGSAGLQIIDVTNPTAPSLVGAVDTPGIAQDLVVVSGRRAYIADGALGLAIVDVSVPSNPRVIRSVDVQGTTKGVDVTDTQTHAVVALGSPSASAVKIIDITDETNPQVVGSVPIPGDAKDLVVRDTYAYVAAYTGGLQIVDISTPGNPRIVGAIPQAEGFVPRDVALSGQFALAAEQLFPNAIPIVEISDPTDPIFQTTIDLSSLGDYAGTGIALTQQFAYVTAERFVVSQDFNATGDTRLFIAQYLAIEDNEGIPPTVSLTSPTPGDDVIEGSTIQITANATDDIAVAVVNFLVDGAIVSTDASAPYQTTIVVPVGVTSLTLGATAIDFGNNSGTAAAVRVDVIPDPLTTVVGLVIDPNSLPVAGASVQTVHGLSDTTAADGSFSIPDVPTILGDIIVSASATIADEQFRGRSSPVPPVPAGITDVGSIMVQGGARVLLLADVDTAGTTALAEALTAAGHEVTRRPAPEYTWDGTNPPLTNFDVVVHLNGATYAAPLPVSAQTALVDFVRNGGGFIGSQWNGFELAQGLQTAMRDLILQLWPFPDNCGGCNMTWTVVPGQEGHPVLEGVPPSFTFFADGHDANPLIQFAQNPSTALMRSPGGGPAVAIREFALGRIVHFSSAANYLSQGRTLQDPHIQRLYVNAVAWSAP